MTRNTLAIAALTTAVWLGAGQSARAQISIGIGGGRGIGIMPYGSNYGYNSFTGVSPWRGYGYGASPFGTTYYNSGYSGYVTPGGSFITGGYTPYIAPGFGAYRNNFGYGVPRMGWGTTRYGVPGLGRFGGRGFGWRGF